MALNLADKQAVVKEVAEVASGAISLVAANYRGLTVSQMTDLRSKAREAGVYLRVVRNTLARRAFDNTEFSCVSEQLTGPLVLVFSQAEPSSAARLVRDFAKDNDALETKFLSIGGELLEAKQLNAVAKLPTKEEAIAQLLSVMQAPITKLAATIREPHAKMVRLFAAVKNSKEAA